MTRDEAIQLVRLAETYWTEKPWTDLDRQTWADDLGPHDAGSAGTTMVRLHRTHDKRPTWKVWLDTYRTIHTGRPGDGHGCSQCVDGWVELAGGQVRPCECDLGRQRQEAHTTAARHNQAAERRSARGDLAVDGARAFAELGRQALEAAGRPLPDPELF